MSDALADMLSPEMSAAINNSSNIIVDEPVVTCLTCSDRGVIVYDLPVGHKLFGKPQPCPDCERGQAQQMRQWNSRLKTVGLPASYQEFTFQTWDDMDDSVREGKRLAYWCARLFVDDPNHAVSMVQAYALCKRHLEYDQVRRSLIFQGGYGLGKTGLAAAIINALIAQQQPVLYIRTQDFLDGVKARFDVKDEYPSAEQVKDTVKTAPVLVLDELNMAASGDWRQETIENVIRYRYSNDLPTVVTCNATKDELTKQWGERTTHVLFAMSHWVPMGGPILRDLRQPASKPF